MSTTVPQKVNTAHGFLHQLAICHLLIAAGVVLLATGHRKLAGALACLVGIGGSGAAWSRWTEDAGGWLDISAALRQRPSRMILHTFAEHLPFAAVGAWLLFRKGDEW